MGLSFIINLDGMKSKALLILLAGLLGTARKTATAQGPPGVTPIAHRVERARLLRLDGLHAIDLANYETAKPNSNLAQPSHHGSNDTNARTSFPSNS